MKDYRRRRRADTTNTKNVHPRVTTKSYFLTEWIKQDIIKEKK